MAVGLPVGVEGRVGVGELAAVAVPRGVPLPEPHPDTLTDAVEL